MIRTLVCLGLLASSTALIAEPKPRSETVGYLDIDLSTSEGRANLDRRLKQAVIRVCPGRIAGNAAVNEAVERCRAETLIAARQRALAAAALRAPNLARVQVSETPAR